MTSASVSDKVFAIRQVLLRNVSFDAPRVADYPQNVGTEDMDQVELNLTSRTWRFLEHRYALELNFEVHATREEKTVFRASLSEIGTFEVVGYTEEEAIRLLRSKGVEEVYPYGREILHSLASRCGIQRLGLPAVGLSFVSETPSSVVVERPPPA